MKKSVFLLGLAVLMGLSFTGCSKGAEKKSDKLTIGVLFDFLGVETRVRQRDFALAFGEENGVNVVFQSADSDEQVQLRQAENLISQGVDAIVIEAMNADACKPIVQGCKEAGIPLIVVDRLIANEDYPYYVGVDNSVIGYMQVEYMLKQKAEGKWAIIGGAPTDPNCIIWHDSYVERIQPYMNSGAIQLVADERCDNWDPNIALRYMENILTVNQDKIDVVMIMNDGLCTGVTQALEARGLAGKVLTCGQDGETVAYQRIVEGKQTFTVLRDDAAIARGFMATAIAAAKGETVVTNGTIDNGYKQVPALMIAPVIIDKNNIDEKVINAGIASRADVYGNAK
ncbi:D-xylose ABC transporter substrate-binding protein [Spirochaetia bacterium]|nr:D-xylose ABC transporter substrate-binding protein [Spirochaetia bacterium]